MQEEVLKQQMPEDNVDLEQEFRLSVEIVFRSLAGMSALRKMHSSAFTLCIEAFGSS
jgi:hypothetical protein